MNLRTIIDYMEQWAPKDLIDSWDNTGFQIGTEDKEIKNVLIALDLDESILKKAIQRDTDLIITHHPIIFKPLKSIISINPKEQIILKTIKNDIAVYNAHSNLDLAIGGVSDALAERLELTNTSNLKNVLEKNHNNKELVYGYGRVGEVDEINFDSFIKKIKEYLDIDNLTVYGNRDKPVKRVAVCGGSGSGFIMDAVKAKSDVYITGDIKYHEAQDAYERDLTLIDIGHFHSEKFILPIIKEYLEKEFKSLNIQVDMEVNVPKKIY